MKIEVILPVVQYDLALNLLKQIDKNTTRPSNVHIIDNTETTHFWDVFENFNLHFHHSTTNRLNESWEIGISKLLPETEYVTFLNDDIIIGNWFFQRIKETFAAIKDCGIVCAQLVGEPDQVLKGAVRFRVERKKMFPACAFTIRRDVLDKIPRFPWERISTFYGDNWVWAHTKQMGYCWASDTGNRMYHYVGKSILQKGFRKLKRPEKNEWEKLKKEVWGG